MRTQPWRIRPVQRPAAPEARPRKPRALPTFPNGRTLSPCRRPPGDLLGIDLAPECGSDGGSWARWIVPTPWEWPRMALLTLGHPAASAQWARRKIINGRLLPGGTAPLRDGVRDWFDLWSIRSPVKAGRRSGKRGGGLALGVDRAGPPANVIPQAPQVWASGARKLRPP